MRRVKCIVTLDALHKQPADYAVWELPIVRHVHADQVQELGETRCNKRVPDPSEEYARLERRYGVNKETLVPRVSEIYGAGEYGVRRLAEAMREDLEEQAKFDGAIATPDVDAAVASKREGKKQGSSRA